MAGELTDTICPIGNVLEVFVSVIFLLPGKQFFYLFSVGKYREMGKLCKKLV